MHAFLHFATGWLGNCIFMQVQVFPVKWLVSVYECTCKGIIVRRINIFLLFTASVFIRDSGMIPYIKIFLDDEMYRSPTLCILEQLSETNPEEYMSTAIGALCSSTESELQLKQDLLHVWHLHSNDFFVLSRIIVWMIWIILLLYIVSILLFSLQSQCPCPELSSKFRDYIQTQF